jgi:hypothetical protein
MAASNSGPTFNYGGTYRFLTPQSYTTATWTVPEGTVYIQAVVWGSSGVNGAIPNGAAGGSSGAGGFASAVIPVTASETLYVGVGNPYNNGRGPGSVNQSGGGFSGIFRGSTPLIIAGGGGGGAENSSASSGAGGGTSGQGSSDGAGGGGTQGAGGSGSNSGSYLQGSSYGGGGGYYGGGATIWYQGSGGGSGYVNAAGNLHTSLSSGSYTTAPQYGDIDYVWATSPGGNSYAFGASGNDSGVYLYGSGIVVIHLLGTAYNSSTAPTIPNPRTILVTY